MFNYELPLPQLASTGRQQLNQDIEEKTKQAVTVSQPISGSDHLKQSGNRAILLNSLPAIVSNSNLVRQRVSAQDCLAAASVTSGATLPLMIGNRSKFVVNLLDAQRQPDVSVMSCSPAGGPKNTALRAEQRRQNMVSVVRPVVNTTSCLTALDSNEQDIKQRLEDKWTPPPVPVGAKASILDEFIELDKKLNSRASGHLELDELLLGDAKLNSLSMNQHLQLSEQQARQQLILLRREEQELNRGIRRQHQFVRTKIEERKRHLLIVQSVWAQRDFKHAMEKLVDLYHQGLVFTTPSLSDKTQSKSHTNGLSSLHTALVVDVIGVLVLRPKLWTLDTCQLLMPIIVNDLLVQEANLEGYVEVGLRALRLILLQFSPVIKSTLDGQKESARLLLGVDLSREERLNKCINCYKLLMEAHSVLARRQAPGRPQPTAKLAPMFREVLQSMATLRASLETSSTISLFRRQ